MTTRTVLNDVNLAAVAKLTQAIIDDSERGQTSWSATVNWRGGLRSEASVRDFGPVRSDEPLALGGDDTAANPVEQLLAALGNCLAVGYAANASVAGIELRGLTIQLDGDLDLHTFLGLSRGNAGYESIRVAVSIDSDASARQLEELHRTVVSTSPVGHTLQRAVPVSIDLA